MFSRIFLNIYDSLYQPYEVGSWQLVKAKKYNKKT